MRTLLLAAALAACTGSNLEPADPVPDTGEPGPPVDDGFAPPEARLHRVTAHAWHAGVQDALGIDVAVDLPVDLRLHGFTSVGASELSIAEADLERYESAAWIAAETALADRATVRDVVGCDLVRAEDPEACVGPWAASIARRAWRRPIEQAEVEALVDLYAHAADLTDSPTVGARAVVASILQSPWFLFRVEIGHVDAEDPNLRRLTDHELAARLSAFLTGGPPDDLLAADADAGVLTDDEVLRGHVQRLLEDPGAEAALGLFAAEWLDLERLQTSDKDPELYPAYTPSLRAAMAIEAEALFSEVALDPEASIHAFLTSDRAFVTPELAAHYGVEGVTETGWITLPEDQQRGGILGRGAFLSVYGHAAATSPTRRGLFVRTRLLCGTVPPPPAGVDTSLDPLDESQPTTLRDRLSAHSEDATCRGCHLLMDPIGLGFEQYDTTGAWRAMDAGLPVDATGNLDGVESDGARELGQLLALDRRFDECLVRNLARHAMGQHETESQLDELAALATTLESRGYRLRTFLEDLVLSDVFRTVGTVDREPCARIGAKRPCNNDCGGGTQTCEGGAWTACTAPTSVPEVCNGIDDDCDGEVDEIVRTCALTVGIGLQTCSEGSWDETCEGPPPPPETCNGEDDDGDGEIDEELEVDLVEASFVDLTARHEACAPGVDPLSGPCRAAAHRTCAASDCSVTGFGLVERDLTDGTGTLACLDASEGAIVYASYTSDLSPHHGPCGTTERWGPNCNAAINRYCRSRGQVTGFGPVENSGDTAVIVCEPEASTFGTTYTELAPFSPEDGPPCDGSSQRVGPACDGAFHGWCRDRGFRTGHGPLENSGDVAWVACIGTLEEDGR